MTSGPVVAIVQARMTSTRLPGKVLLPVAGRPLLSWQLDRMRLARRLDRIVIATTTNATDDPIVAWCRAQGCDVTRGSEADVLSRYAQAAVQFGAGTVVRLTSDCPLIDPALIDSAVERFVGAGCDYLSNMLHPSFPYGLAVEVMTARALAQAQQEAVDPQECEHVTPFIYWRPGRFRLESLTTSPDCSQHRWTVDTPQDFELVSHILHAMAARHPGFSWREVLDLLDRHPEWVKINAQIEQKAVKRGAQDDP